MEVGDQIVLPQWLDILSLGSCLVIYSFYWPSVIEGSRVCIATLLEGAWVHCYYILLRQEKKKKKKRYHRMILECWAMLDRFAVFCRGPFINRVLLFIPKPCVFLFFCLFCPPPIFMKLVTKFNGFEVGNQEVIATASG